jgi:hypothetical protein
MQYARADFVRKKIFCDTFDEQLNTKSAQQNCELPQHKGHPSLRSRAGADHKGTRRTAFIIAD